MFAPELYEWGLAAYRETLDKNLCTFGQEFSSRYPGILFTLPLVDELVSIASCGGVMASVRHLVVRLVDACSTPHLSSEASSAAPSAGNESAKAIRPYRISRTGVIHTRLCQRVLDFAEEWTTLEMLEAKGCRCCKVCKPNAESSWRSAFEKEIESLCQRLLIEPAKSIVKPRIPTLAKRRPEEIGVLIDERGFFHPTYDALGRYFPPSMTRVQINDIYVRNIKLHLIDPIAGLRNTIEELRQLASETNGRGEPSERRRELISRSIRNAAKEIDKAEHPEKYQGLCGCASEALVLIGALLAVVIIAVYITIQWDG